MPFVINFSRSTRTSLAGSLSMSIARFTDLEKSPTNSLNLVCNAKAIASSISIPLNMSPRPAKVLRKAVVSATMLRMAKAPAFNSDVSSLALTREPSVDSDSPIKLRAFTRIALLNLAY